MQAPALAAFLDRYDFILTVGPVDISPHATLRMYARPSDGKTLAVVVYAGAAWEILAAPTAGNAEDKLAAVERWLDLDNLTDDERTAAADCPYGEPLHDHHDGCPACSFEPVPVEVYPDNKLPWAGQQVEVSVEVPLRSLDEGAHFRFAGAELAYEIVGKTRGVVVARSASSPRCSNFGGNTLVVPVGR